MIVLLESLLVIAAACALYVVARSFVVIGPAEVGLVIKRVSRRHNTTDTRSRSRAKRATRPTS